MSRVVLVEASPADPVTGAAVAVRLAGGGSRPYTHLGQNDWRAGVVDLPRFTAEIGFGETGWTGGATPQTSDMRFYPAQQSTVDYLARLYWNNAPVTVRIGDDAANPATFTVALTGTVARIDVTTGVVTVTLADLAVDLSKPVLVDRFGGTGGVDGGDDAAQRIKRRSWGEVFNVAGELLDKVNNVYEFGDPSKPLWGIRRLRDKGREGPIAFLGWQGSIAATFAALQTSVPQQGGGVVAPSIACAKWWTTPSGPLTADLYGETGAAYVDTVAQIAQAVVAARSAIQIANVGYGVALRGMSSGVHVDNDSETVAQVLDRLLLGVSLVWTLDPSGVIQLSEWKFGDSSNGIAWTHTGGAALAWSPSSPAPLQWQYVGDGLEVITSQSVARKSIYAPIGKRRIGYQRNQRIQSDGEVSSAILASDTFYPDGTPADALQPAQAGADVTGQNTSKDTNAVGGVPATDLINRVVSLQDILAPSGEVFQAISDIAKANGQVSTRTDTLEQQMSGVGESYLKSQTTVAIGAAGAAASSVSTLRSDVFGDNGLAAQVTIQQGTLNLLSGRTLAYWQVEADAGPAGTDAFVTVQAETQPGQPVTSNVAIGAQAFFVFNSVNGQWLKSFEVSGGNVRIYGNLELDGSVVTRNLQPGTVGVFFTVTGSDGAIGTGETTLVEMPGYETIGDAVDGSALIVFSAGYDTQAVYDKKGMFKLYVDMNDGNGYQFLTQQPLGVRGVGGANVQAKLATALQRSVAAPKVRVKVTGQSQNFADTNGSGSFFCTSPTISLAGAQR